MPRVSPTWRILEGDCRAQLATLEPGSVQTCVTSPPYFGLRDYGHAGQIGLEPTPDEFVAALVDVFRAVRRVLRDDGTVWLNLGDSYSGSGPSGASYQSDTTKRRAEGDGTDGAFRISKTLADRGLTYAEKKPIPAAGTKPKDLIGIPWMVAFALRADGWYLRSDIIWSKPNPMPESVTDRPTKAHEYLFLLSKSARYFYDADAVREPGLNPEDDLRRMRGDREKRYSQEAQEARGTGTDVFRGGEPSLERLNLGRNRRTVWTVATQPFPGAHFATFPAKLIEPCILAGSSPLACAECGAPWQRITERTTVRDRARLLEGGKAGELVGSVPGYRNALSTSNSHDGATTPEVRTVGWESSCGHANGSGSCVVLDPFSGSGTTGMVALRHGRSFVGCELNPEYVQLARNRIVDDAPLLNSVLEEAA